MEAAHFMNYFTDFTHINNFGLTVNRGLMFNVNHGTFPDICLEQLRLELNKRDWVLLVSCFPSTH